MSDMLTCEVVANLKKKRQILFSASSEFLRDLSELLREQNRRTVCLWAFDLAAGSVAGIEEKYPEEIRPALALQAAKAWARGEIKMRQAQRCILDCHLFARETETRADAAAVHAIGQACSVVHTAGHAMGYPVYDLTSVVLSCGGKDFEDAVKERKHMYITKLLYYSAHCQDYHQKWAYFLMR